MVTISKSVYIDAPVERVFAYIHNPRTAPDYWNSMVDTRNIVDLGGGRKSFHWTYKMAGVRLEGSSEITECAPHERLVIASRGGVESVFTWTFAREGIGTRASLVAEYKVPLPVLGKLAEHLITRQNEREADLVFANLKMLMEMPIAIERP